MNSTDTKRIRRAALKRWRKGEKLRRDAESSRKSQLMARAFIDMRHEDYLARRAS